MKDWIATSVFWMVWSRGVVHLVSLLSALIVAPDLEPRRLRVDGAIGATVIMAGLVLAIRWTLPVADSIDRLVRLGLAASLGALTYVLVMLRWGGALVGEVAEVTGWLLPRRHFLPRSVTAPVAKPSGN